MSWNEARSRKRIREHLKTVPRFDSKLTLARQSRMLVEARAKGLMDSLSTRTAFVVEGAHLYGQLLDFDRLASESNGNETEASHRILLQMLDTQYRLWDAIVENDEADRVDYHGARMHTIVSSPSEPVRQIERAAALAVKLGNATRRIASFYDVPMRIRFGIDQGKCVALTTGRAHERDTLFLGSPANHAAKIAASDDEEGIYLTPWAQSIVGESNLVAAAPDGTKVLRDAFFDQALRRNPFDRIDRAVDRLIAEASNDRKFIFFRPTPPLSDLKFADLTPSNSARMGMASVFADIDGFTAFVDEAIQAGGEAIKQAATSLHVIREELNDVLKEDFGGKRVRFIGDCIQGVIAKGQQADDPTSAVREAAYCAAGMRSSFQLCQQYLEGIESLDLAIGIEYGPVPLTRLGLRGEDSVRCATGRAVVIAEKVQQSIEVGGVDMGPSARAVADPAVRRYFSEARAIPGYDSAMDLLAAPTSPSVRIVKDEPAARSHTESA